jgi:hypothetical protein
VIAHCRLERLAGGEWSRGSDRQLAAIPRPVRGRAVHGDRIDLGTSEIEVERRQVLRGQRVDRGRRIDDGARLNVEVEVDRVVDGVIAAVAQQRVVGIADPGSTGRRHTCDRRRRCRGSRGTLGAADGGRHKEHEARESADEKRRASLSRTLVEESVHATPLVEHRRG